MNGPYPESRFDELSRKIENLPDDPPIPSDGTTTRPLVILAFVQLFFVVVALVGLVVLVLRTEESRIAQCASLNQTRTEIVKVLVDSRARNPDPDMQRKFDGYIKTFAPIDCQNPEKNGTSSRP